MDGLSGRPKAPRDPEGRRPAVYVMLDDYVEGSPQSDGSFVQNIFLEGRIAAKIRAVAPGLPEETAQELQTWEGFLRMVHSVGITAVCDEPQHRELSFLFQLNSRGKAGMIPNPLCVRVPCNGREAVFTLPEPSGTEEASTERTGEEGGRGVLTSFQMLFPCYMTARTTVCFYLREGYYAPEIVPDAPVAFGSPVYREMIGRSCMQLGDCARLKEAIRKARRGEEVTLAYIGGSVTQGAGAKPIAANSYAFRSCQAFRRRFGVGDGSHIRLVKAGVGGTSSELGLARYETDVLRHGQVEPDIVIIEFAVNDLGDETDGVCYESLALMAMEGPGHPAVILLFAVFMDDWNLQDRMAKVGIRYRLPMVSVKDAVVTQFYEDKPVITKRQFFYDLFHPSNDGHRIMADCLDYLWEQADRAADMQGGSVSGTAAEEEPPVYGDTYRRLRAFTRDTVPEHACVRFLDCGSFTDTDTQLQCVEKDDHPYATPEFACNWMHTGGTGGSFRMRICCKDLLLIYKDSGNPAFGKAEVWIDNKAVCVIDPLEVGWNHCNAVIICREESAREHMVELRPLQEDGGGYFTLLGFGYTLS